MRPWRFICDCCHRALADHLSWPRHNKSKVRLCWHCYHAMEEDWPYGQRILGDR